MARSRWRTHVLRTRAPAGDHRPRPRPPSSSRPRSRRRRHRCSYRWWYGSAAWRGCRDI
uniref:Uncharacterized protein n=1 Tax=Arundo donax TaxID=35708 RepID=A0A0A8ZJM5_ARUDO